MTTTESTRVRRAVLFGDVLREIDAHFHEWGYDLDALARNVGTSRRQAQRVLAEAGTSFRAVVRKRRMDRAAELLVETTHPVKDIAAAVGFRSMAQFGRIFRRRSTCSPTEYRERHGEVSS